MYENNEQPQPAEPASAVLTYEELMAKCQGLEADNRSLMAQLNSAKEKNQVLSSTLDKAANWVREGIEGSIDVKDTIQEYRELIDILGVEMTRKVEIEIAVSWRGSIELPYGVEVEDLDVDDFDISISQHNEYDSDISYYFEDSSISERRW